MPHPNSWSIEKRREYNRLKQRSYRARLKQAGPGAKVLEGCYDMDRLAFRGGTTVRDLEEWLGRELRSSEIDLWIIAGWTGSRQFRNLGGNN